MPVNDVEKESRPAIERDPLPQAGASVHKKMVRTALDAYAFWGMSLGLLGLLTAMEWVRYVFDVKSTLSSALLMTVMAVGFGVMGVKKIRKAPGELENLRKGLRGEMHVGEYLHRECASLGYRVFHDIEFEGQNGAMFNIDHVLIGPGGVFSIETKYRMKPLGPARLEFDGKGVSKQGLYHTREPAQARRNAKDLERLLTAGAGKQVKVLAVLVYPGWYVQDVRPKPWDMWMFGDNTIHTFLPNEPQRLSGSEINELCRLLEGHVVEMRKREEVG